MSVKKKIGVVITARASYSRCKTALEAIRDHESLELMLIVTASALLGRFGNAAKVMEDDGFTITARVYNVVESGNLTGQVKTTGLGMIELANVFDSLKPDVVVTIADRYETMSTAITAAYMNIPLAHIQGGEVTGNIDEKVRHAITKLADLHLVSTTRAKERVLKMGEAENLVYVTGCPSIDLAHAVQEREAIDLNFNPYNYGGVGSQPALGDGYLVVMQHPVTSEFGLAREHIEETLWAVEELKIPALWFWPNIDAGSDGTSNGIRAFREIRKPEKIHFFKNMPPTQFLQLLKGSKALIGNSSVGIRECSYLGVPIVNIGSRQKGRERGANTIDVSYDRHEIISAVRQQLAHGPYSGEQIYGQGNAGVAIADILAKAELQSDKRITY
ncbi:UDP-N-acetylglucosamine 2-epimerase [Roseivirga sp.]|uniref:UDP-N-acetylglucosamine 2-epimerase n=1 Tax=Roseivirga sp. TaxID=1964215 RepID=UPI003B8BD873